MKISKQIVLSAFACAFALGASAQEGDGYVYETDILSCQTLNFNSSIDREYKKDVFINSTLYSISCLYSKANSCYSFDAYTEYGLIVKKTKGIVKCLRVDWHSLSKGASVELYIKDSPYNNVTELFNSNSRGIYVGDYIYSQDPIIINMDRLGYYFGLKNISNKTAFLSSLSITWQLAHIRENLTVGNLGTICLPYDVKAEDWADELTAYTIAGKVMNSTRDQIEALVFEEVDEMKAGVAYLFVPKKSDICLKYYGAEVKEPVESQYGLIGSFENYTFTENDCRDNNLFLISNNSIRLAGAGAGVGANRAYIKMSKEMPEYHETNSSRKLLVSANGYIETGDSPTIVEMLKAIASLKDGQNQTSTAYDLQGRMVSGTSAKGIVIENGKKKYISVR